jgi:hypothetical protein
MPFCNKLALTLMVTRSLDFPRFKRATKQRKSLELTGFDGGERTRAMPLNPMPVNEATMLAWAQVLRETALLRVPCHVWAR